jgi:hypothetical protein
MANKGFIVLEGKTYKDALKDPYSCYDTVRSQFYTNKTVKECQEICHTSDRCGAGYHIANKKGDSICVPLRTNIFPDANPAYNIVDGTDPELIYTTFIDVDKFEYPPKDAGIVFCGDILRLNNVDNDSHVETAVQDEPIQFGSKGFVKMTIMDPNLFLNIPLKQQLNYGDPIVIVLDGTSLVMMNDGSTDKRLKWLLRLTPDFNENQTFYLVSAEGKDIGDTVNYNDKFHIVRNGQVSCLVVNNDSNTLEDFGPGPEAAKYRGLSSTFSFTRASPLYSCVEGKCEEIDISEVEYAEGDATYFGKPVYRDPGCFGVCSNATTLKSTFIPKSPKKDTFFVLFLFWLAAALWITTVYYIF